MTNVTTMTCREPAGIHGGAPYQCDSLHGDVKE